MIYQAVLFCYTCVMNRITMLLIIGLLAGGGMALFAKNDATKTTNTTISVTVIPAAGAKSVQMQTAEKFYKAFTACMKTQESTYCATHINLSTKNLGTNLQKQTTPVICSQTIPNTVSASKSTVINDNQALVTLREDFGKNKMNVIYQMQRENGEWKVENILCPK
jgi:hypothetical protein